MDRAEFIEPFSRAESQKKPKKTTTTTTSKTKTSTRQVNQCLPDFETLIRCILTRL